MTAIYISAFEGRYSVVNIEKDGASRPKKHLSSKQIFHPDLFYFDMAHIGVHTPTLGGCTVVVEVDRNMKTLNPIKNKKTPPSCMFAVQLRTAPAPHEQSQAKNTCQARCGSCVRSRAH